MKKYAFFLLLLSQAFIHADSKQSPFEELLEFTRQQNEMIKSIAENNFSLDENQLRQLESVYFQKSFSDEMREEVMHEYYNNPTSPISQDIKKRFEKFALKRLHKMKSEMAKIVLKLASDYNHDIENIDHVSFEVVQRIKINNKIVDSNEEQPAKVDFSPFLKEAKIKAQAEKLQK